MAGCLSPQPSPGVRETEGCFRADFITSSQTVRYQHQILTGVALAFTLHLNTIALSTRPLNILSFE